MPLHSRLPVLLAPAFVGNEYQSEDRANCERKRRSIRRIFSLPESSLAFQRLRLVF
jgi:hypothetical protein